MTVELGLIEGFYGRPWSWEQRADAVCFLAPHGYGFYLYAPKADPYLRRRWQEPHPDPMADALHSFARLCEAEGVRFGVGLSPYELYLDFNEEARAALRDKLVSLRELGTVDLAVLFDDMRGDTPDLARRQLEIVDWIAAHAGVERLLVCPSYYTDDPVLDRVFGRRPDGYLEELAAGLDRTIEILWTGEEVCAREISPAHLDRVAQRIGRLPFLWDNYPVNDGRRMSQYLHLRGFTGRPAANATRISGHGINVALQPTLTRIPALTLAERYRVGDERYQYGEAFARAARMVLGEELGEWLREDLLILQDVGLDRLGEKEAPLRERYGHADHPGAREIIAWLNGEYRITDEIVRTQ
ncbi:MAG TPA: beta-N-acetylglucosaminidase domain-containing protein [Longimicrobiaceae bacterium]